jgi:hypothetical protein
MNSDQIRLQISSKINGFMTEQNLGMGEAGERRNHLIACIQEAVDGLLAAILQPQPAPLPEDAIETALAVYDAHFSTLPGSYFPREVRLAGMAAVLRNFAQRPDVLGEPNEDDEGYAYSAGAALRPYQIVCNFLKQRRTRLFAPKEPSLEQELNEICSYAATIEESPRETSRKILALIQCQQGKGKE